MMRSTTTPPRAAHLPALVALCAASFALPALGAQGGGGSLGVYGAGSPGKGGIVPEISALGATKPGNTSFKLSLAKGLGGAIAIPLVSSGSASLKVLDFTLLVDGTAPVFLVPFASVLGGGTGVAGAGFVDATAPIPNLPALVGFTVYAQWLVFDTAAASGLVASDGLRVTFNAGPLVLAGGVRSLVDYVPGQTTVGTTTMGSSVSDVQFDRAGRTAYLCVGKTFTILDVRAKPFKTLASTGFAGLANSAAVHPKEDFAYVLVPHRTSPRIAIIDIKPGSTGFGKSAGSVTGLPTTGLADMEGCSISANGKILVVAVMGFVGKRSILVVDVDPASTKRNAFVKQIAITAGGSFGMLTDVDVAASGGFAYACVSTLTGGSFVLRVLLANGAVLNTVSHTGKFSTDIDLDPRGRFLVVSNPNSGNLTHVDLRSGPGFFKARHFVAPTPQVRFFSVALTPDATQAVAVGNGVGDIYAFDVATGKVAWSVKSSVSGASIAVR